MRIGIEASDLVAEKLTGIEYALSELVAHLPQADTQTEFALYLNFVRKEYAERFTQRVQPLLSERVKAYVCRMPNRVMQVLHNSLQYPLDWSIGKSDVVLYPSFAMHAQRRGARVATIHDLMPITHAAYFSEKHVSDFQRIVPKIAREADALIAVSEYTKQMLVTHLSIPAEKITVVHHGVSTLFQPAHPSSIDRVKQKYQLQKPYILFVGTAEPRKNLKRLLEAMTILLRYYRLEVDLVIVGKAAWGSPAIQACIEKHALADHVHLLGHIESTELPAIYSGAMAAVQPSIAEGFGMPVLEAMACGTPIVIANTSALPEVAGDAALQFNPDQAEELAHQLSHLIENTPLRENMVNKGKLRAAEFTWAKAAHNTLNTLKYAASNAYA